MEGNLSRRASLVSLQQDYQAPRELEHPLHSLNDIDVATLVWIQPEFMRPAYELWAGEKVVATLRYKSLFQPGALAVSYDGLWTIEEAGIHMPVINVCQGRQLVGAIKRQPGLINELTLKGSTYYWVRKGFWTKEWVFTDEWGQPLLHFQPEASLKARLRVQIVSGKPPQDEMTLLMLLGKYLMLSRGSTADAN